MKGVINSRDEPSLLVTAVSERLSAVAASIAWSEEALALGLFCAQSFIFMEYVWDPHAAKSLVLPGKEFPRAVPLVLRLTHRQV